MNVLSALQRRAREARAWLVDACLPLWGSEGVSGTLFAEALDLNHRASVTETTRVRVQARQTYVFAEAARLGWSPDEAHDLVQMGIMALTNQARREDGLFGRTLASKGMGLVDDTADLYDTAFALHAIAHAGPDTHTDTINTILTGLETHLADPAGGYAEALPKPAYRLQNPHMHLFEACLALFHATGDDRHIQRSDQLHALCLDRFIDDTTGTLGERFALDWASIDGKNGARVEPGHQFEWVWLLGQYARARAIAPARELDRLYRFACSTLDEDGRAIQETDRTGTPQDASRRTWPQTEALKAHLYQWQRGDDEAGHRAIASFDILMDEYLTPEGGWIDHYDANGQVLAQDMPASTLYHIMLAFTYLMAVTDA